MSHLGGMHTSPPLSGFIWHTEPIFCCLQFIRWQHNNITVSSGKKKKMSESIEHSLSVVIKQPPNPITINFHHPGTIGLLKKDCQAVLRRGELAQKWGCCPLQSWLLLKINRVSWTVTGKLLTLPTSVENKEEKKTIFLRSSLCGCDNSTSDTSRVLDFERAEVKMTNLSMHNKPQTCSTAKPKKWTLCLSLFRLNRTARFKSFVGNSLN